MGYGGKQASRSGDVRRFNFTGNGSNTAFDLGFTPASPNQLIVTVNGVIQHYDAFSLTGSTMTFTGTPAAGDAIQVTAVVDAVGIAGIPQGAIANLSSLSVSGTIATPLTLANSSANVVTFASNGHVGIGNTSPYNGQWGANTVQLCIGNYNVNYGSVHLNGGSGSNTSYSFGVGEGNFYMAYDNTAQQHRMIATANGAIRMPYQPHARASRNSGVVLGGSVVIFNFADENGYNMYNTTTGRFTAPVTGKYVVCHGLFAQTGYSAWIKWRVNGSVVATTYTNVTSAYSSAAGSIVLQVNANDYIDIYLDVPDTAYRVYGNDRSQCWATCTFLG